MTAPKTLCRIRPSLGQGSGSQVVISGFNRVFLRTHKNVAVEALIPVVWARAAPWEHGGYPQVGTERSSLRGSV